MDIPKQTEWVHAVMVYNGIGRGITVYHDGVPVGSDYVGGPSTRLLGEGVVLVGRRVLSGNNPRYASAYVDEIKFYNYQLSAEQVCKLY